MKKLEKLNEILSRILRIDERSIRDDMGPSSVRTWDSLSSLSIISELEKSFEVSFTMDEVQGIQNVGDIRKILQTRGIRLDD